MTSFAVPPELLCPDEDVVEDDEEEPELLLDPELVSPVGGVSVVDSAQPKTAR